MLLPLLGADDEVIAFFAGVADLDATDPADRELEDGVRLASGARLEQFARAGSGDAFCFVGEGGEERPVVYVSLDGEAGPLALGLPELVRLCLVAPWWRDAPGRTAEELQAVADEYRDDLPDLGRRRERAPFSVCRIQSAAASGSVRQPSSAASWASLSCAGTWYQPARSAARRASRASACAARSSGVRAASSRSTPPTSPASASWTSVIVPSPIVPRSPPLSL
jgi:hypothetical protein